MTEKSVEDGSSKRPCSTDDLITDLERCSKKSRSLGMNIELPINVRIDDVGAMFMSENVSPKTPLTLSLSLSLSHTLSLTGIPGNSHSWFLLVGVQIPS